MALFRGPRSLDRLSFAVAIGAALVFAVVAVKEPMPALAALVVLVMTMVFGLESLIAIAVLGATGLLPFVHIENYVVGNIKYYFFFFLVAAGSMLLAYLVRSIAGRPAWRMPSNWMSWGIGALLAWVIVVAVGSHPMEQTSLTAPFFVLPLIGVATMLWLSHDEALAGVIRMLPLVVALLVCWCLAYDAGAAGCVPCQHYVSTGIIHAGLLGEHSRLYTAGQNSFLGVFLVGFAYMLAKPRPLSITLVAIGASAIILQDSRMQWIGVAVGMGLLLAWKFGQLRIPGKIVLLILVALAFVAVATSPVGTRAVAAYTELKAGTGTGGVRLEVIKNTKEYWTLFGQGFSSATLRKGWDVDLGLPNTILVLGYVGAILQLALLCIGIWRGIMAKTLVGTTIAAILLMVLVSRASLPLLEYGHSAVMYGGVMAFAAWLRLAPAHATVPIQPRAVQAT